MTVEESKVDMLKDPSHNFDSRLDISNDSIDYGKFKSKHHHKIGHKKGQVNKKKKRPKKKPLH